MAETREDAVLVEDLKRSNALQQAEIHLFECYLTTVDLQAETEMTSQGGVKKTRVQSPDGQHFLTIQQKCDVARTLLKHLNEDLKGLQINSERALENHKATLEEADVHLAEVKKESCQFDRDIVKALRYKGSLMRVEKVIRYIEDKIKAKDNLIEKLDRQNTALLTQKRKLQLQINIQEKMGKGLTALDFEQLKIENIRSRKQLDEQNHKHMELKLLAGKTSQAMNSNKEKLQTLIQESDAKTSDITSRKKLMVKIEEETQQAEEERSKAEALNRKLRGQLADFEVPHVLQYIEVKDSHNQLEKNVKAWERKVEIAEMALKTYTKAWDKLRTSVEAGQVHF